MTFVSEVEGAQPLTSQYGQTRQQAFIHDNRTRLFCSVEIIKRPGRTIKGVFGMHENLYSIMLRFVFKLQKYDVWLPVAEVH
jgi:hypothetical protein